jgi:hypothetical protein
VHRADDAKVLEPVVADLEGEDLLGDHADDLAARRPRGVGDGAHQPDPRAAVDEPQPALGQLAAGVLRGLRVGRVRPRARAAEHAHA